MTTAAVKKKTAKRTTPKKKATKTVPRPGRSSSAGSSAKAAPPSETSSGASTAGINGTPSAEAELQAVREKAKAFKAADEKWQKAKSEAARLKTIRDELETDAINMSAGDNDGSLVRRMEPDGWRREPIEEALSEIQKGQVEKLRTGTGARMMGELVDWLGKKSLLSVAGIGAETAGKIADAVHAFFKGNPTWVHKTPTKKKLTSEPPAGKATGVGKKNTLPGPGHPDGPKQQ